MSVADCLELPQPGALPELNIPQLGLLKIARQSLYDLPDPSYYILKLQDVMQVALAPLRRFLELMELMVAFQNCQFSIIDAVSQLSPGPIIDCLKDLIEAFVRLVAYIPPFSYFATMLDLANYVILTIDELISLFELIDARITSLRTAQVNALALGDTDLAVIVDCASDDLNVQIVNSLDIVEVTVPLLQLLLDPLARLMKNPVLNALLGNEFAQATAFIDTLSSLQDDIANTTGPPVLSPVLEGITIIRNIAVSVYNVFAPLAGKAADKTTRAVPQLQNL